MNRHGTIARAKPSAQFDQAFELIEGDVVSKRRLEEDELSNKRRRIGNEDWADLDAARDHLERQKLEFEHRKQAVADCMRIWDGALQFKHIDDIYTGNFRARDLINLRRKVLETFDLTTSDHNGHVLENPRKVSTKDFWTYTDFVTAFQRYCNIWIRFFGKDNREAAAGMSTCLEQLRLVMPRTYNESRIMTYALGFLSAAMQRPHDPLVWAGFQAGAEFALEAYTPHNEKETEARVQKQKDEDQSREEAVARARATSPASSDHTTAAELALEDMRFLTGFDNGVPGFDGEIQPDSVPNNQYRQEGNRRRRNRNRNRRGGNNRRRN